MRDESRVAGVAGSFRPSSSFIPYPSSFIRRFPFALALCVRKIRHMKILMTGSAGFIGGYVVEELLSAGHDVVGLDNFSKYGEVRPRGEGHPRYALRSRRCQGRGPAPASCWPTATTSSPGRR